jgi:ankyrin repeat protein
MKNNSLKKIIFVFSSCFLLHAEQAYGNNNIPFPIHVGQGRPAFQNIPSLAPLPDGHKKNNIDFLLFNGQEGNPSMRHVFTPLMNAAEKGAIEKVQRLLFEGEDINAFTDTGVTALMVAAKNGHIEIVRLLCEKGAKINNNSFGPMSSRPPMKGYAPEFAEQTLKPFQVDLKYYDSKNNGFTPLALAIAYGQNHVAEFLISQGADLHRKSFGASPLAIAIYYGQPALAAYLINQGAELNPAQQMVGQQGDLLYQSLQRNYWDLAAIFIDKGNEDLNSVTNTIHGVPPLHYYSRIEQLAVMKFLHSKGANPNLYDMDGMSPIHYASLEGKQKAVELLLIFGADINAASLQPSKKVYMQQWGATPLVMATSMGHVELVKFLVKQGADIEAKDQQGRTSLFFAIKNTFENVFAVLKAGEDNEKKYFTVADFLISHGADINCQDINGDSPLLYVTHSGSGSLAAMKYLIEKGANVNRENNEGMTPIIVAVKDNKLEKVQLLINSGSLDLNKKESLGRPPLWFSAQNTGMECAKLLIDHGADINERLPSGNTLLMDAIQREFFVFADLLMEKGAGVNGVNKKGETALIIAVEKNNLGIIKNLVERGADINAKDNTGITPFFAANRGGNQSIIEYLEKNGADTSCWKKHLEQVQTLQGKGLLPNSLDPKEISPQELLFFKENGFGW